MGADIKGKIYEDARKCRGHQEWSWTVFYPRALIKTMVALYTAKTIKKPLRILPAVLEDLAAHENGQSYQFNNFLVTVWRIGISPNS
jgi:hypothetical protein